MNFAANSSWISPVTTFVPGFGTSQASFTYKFFHCAQIIPAVSSCIYAFGELGNTVG